MHAVVRSAVLLAFLSTGAASQASQAPRTPRAPLLIQGALALETSRLIDSLHATTIDHVGGWTFWRGTLDGYPVVVSRTMMGGTNAAAATAIAIERYHPRAIINQGTSGGHDPALRVGDIVLGASAVSVAAFKSQHRAAGRGADVLTWTAMDVSQHPGDADGEMHMGHVLRIAGDGALLAAARAAGAAGEPAGGGRVVSGTIGSSDVWNDEIDRIRQLHTAYGTSVEEMETAPAAQVAASFHTPFLGVRVVSDNAIDGVAFDPRTGAVCQDFVVRVARAYIATLRRP